MSDLMIQDGEYYRQRNGKIIGPAKVYKIDGGAFSNDYPVSCGGYTYTFNGVYYKEGDKHLLDLVEHIPLSDERHPGYMWPYGEETDEVLNAYVEAYDKDGEPVFDELRWTLTDLRPLSVLEELVTVVDVVAMPGDE